MHFQFPARLGRLKLLILAVGVLCCGLSGALQAQADGRLAASARPYTVNGNDRRLLDQLQRFLDAQQWNDAWRLVDRLVATNSTSVVPIEKTLYISLPDYCHRLLSQLPNDGLASYRQRVDPTAEAWYRQGIAGRDPLPLRRVIDEAFCSSWGDDALLALGELALVRGEYQQAKTYWRTIHGGHSNLIYPDSDIPEADILARLALVSIRSGQWELAADQVARLAASHPKARGRLAGSDVVYAERLAELLDQSRHMPAVDSSQQDWPTEGASFARTFAVSTNTGSQWQTVWSHPYAAAGADTRSVFPVVIDAMVVYQDNTGVHALQLATGLEEFHSDNATFRSSGSTLTAFDSKLFGTSRGQSATNSSVWGLDLDRDGALSFLAEPDDSDTVFSGAPIVDGTHLLLEMRASDHSTRSGVTCFDLATGNSVWQRWLCRANPPAGQQGSNLLTASPGVVYVSTELGAIVAVRAEDGQILWLRTYSRKNPAATEETSSRVHQSCAYQQGVLYVLPADSRQLFALDASTGAILWNRSGLRSSARMVGVTEDRVVLADEGLHLFDPVTGDVLMNDFDTPLVGQAVVANDVIYWPENQSVQMFDLMTGKKLPGELPLGETGGANVLVAGEYLLAAGPTQLTVFRAASDPVNDTGKLSQSHGEVSRESRE